MQPLSDGVSWVKSFLNGMDGFGISIQNTLFGAKDQEQEGLAKRAGHMRVSATTYRTGTSS